MLEHAKSSILPTGNFREFFLWWGECCVFKTGIPGGPVRHHVNFHLISNLVPASDGKLLFCLHTVCFVVEGDDWPITLRRPVCCFESTSLISIVL